MSNINYEVEVKKVYPDAETCIARDPYCALAMGLYVIRRYRVFGFKLPILDKIISHGFTEQDAWKDAYEKLTKTI